MTDTPALPPFYSLVALARIDSTNEEAKRLAAAGSAEGTLVWAREQTAGRGRRGRAWSSPPGNLYMSVLLRPACAPEVGSQVGYVAAVALAEALEGLLPAAARPVSLKWPNDVLVGDAKISGILLEASAAADRTLDWLVLGIGVNVVASPADTPYPATNLCREGACQVTEAGLLEALAGRFLEWYQRWRSQGFGPVRERWLAGARGLGEPIEVRLETEVLKGRFADLDETGALALELPAGSRRRITAGDVYYPNL
jgi:BirA family biotin operon repressor/biotin-[acetyl-CoA-carboxylase] ligase